jgi:hypothetical protein
MKIFFEFLNPINLLVVEDNVWSPDLLVWQADGSNPAKVRVVPRQVSVVPHLCILLCHFLDSAL